MNRYVVLARFDKNTEEKLIALRREMTNAGYASSEWPPHITLAAYEDPPRSTPIPCASSNGLT